MEDRDVNLYQKVGEIGGKVDSIDKQIADFRMEFRSSTNDQNRRIEGLETKINGLEQFKANYEGAKSEAKRSAMISGSFTGGGVAAAFEGLKWSRRS